ncbi:MAG: MFS transporter, partial [Actinobacteria bacterium]|nr:MFS transporter [Actinomycetota bacterium]
MTDTTDSSTPVSRRLNPHKVGSARAAFHVRDFRRIWFGSFASNIGTWIQNVVLPVYVYARTGRASFVALLIFAQLGPILLLSIPGGVIADRVDRKKFLISMQAVQLICSLLLALFAANNSPIWMLFLAQLGVGVGNALNIPAWSAMLTSLVPPSDIAGAISLNSTVINGARVVGPIIVALLSQWNVTSSEFFAINAVTYLFVIFALLSVKVPAIAFDTTAGWRRFTFAFKIARERVVISRLILTLASFSLLSLPYVGLFPAIAQLNFGIESQSATYNWLYATWGLGACIGGLSVSTLFVDIDNRKLIRMGFASFAVSMMGFALAPNVELAFLTVFFLGAAYFFTTTAMQTVFASGLTPAIRARVMSLWFMAFGGTVP